MSWMLSVLAVCVPVLQGPTGGANHTHEGAAVAAAPAVEAPVFEVDDSFVDRAVQSFERKSKRDQAKILAAVRAAVGELRDPFLDAVADSARAAAKSRSSNVGKLPKKGVFREARDVERQGDPGLYGDAGFPAANQYRFGFASVVAAVEGRRSSKPKFPAQAPAGEQLRALLRGLPPDLDLAIAGVLRTLDSDRSADRFASYLECVREGDESFYRAMDRAASSGRPLFYADVMLDDFVAQFVPKKHPDAAGVRQSRPSQQAAMHNAFVAYRRYRAMREALAFSLLLPPDVDLPKALAPYDVGVEGGYGFRERVAILVRLSGRDIHRVVDAVLAAAPPLPEHLWAADYDPFPAFSEVFHEALDSTDEFGGDSDRILADEYRLRTDLARRIARAAREALRGVGIE